MKNDKFSNIFWYDKHKHKQLETNNIGDLFQTFFNKKIKNNVKLQLMSLLENASNRRNSFY